MIEIFEGRLGAFKSYSAVERVLEALAADAVVYTNVAMEHDRITEGFTETHWQMICRYCREVYRVEPNRDQLRFVPEGDMGAFHRATCSGSLVVLDEIHLWFNAKDYGENWDRSREVFEFLTQSRKYDTDIILISQSAQNMDRQFVRLVQYIWRFRDMQKFIIPVLGLQWPFAQLAQMRYDYDGKTMFDRKLKWKDKRIYGCYDTKAVYRNKYERKAAERLGHAVKIQRWGWRNVASGLAWCVDRLRHLLRGENVPKRRFIWVKKRYIESVRARRWQFWRRDR